MTPEQIELKAKQLAQEWHNSLSNFFREIGVEYSWEGLGEISQDYWKNLTTGE